MLKSDRPSGFLPLLSGLLWKCRDGAGLLHGAAQLLRTGRSETVLRLKNGEYVTVTGSDLICSAYEDRSVEVLGRITAIAFGRSEPAKKGEEETTDETP